MTTPDPGMLLSATDFAKFQAKDQDWFLGAVGDTIREHCGWHISPVLQTTNYLARVGNKGIIMLPTLTLVTVDALKLWDATVVDSRRPLWGHPPGLDRLRRSVEHEHRRFLPG